MIALVFEARNALYGIFKLISFKDDWRPFFDISSGGVARSFGAAILALVPYVLIVASVQYARDVAASQGQDVDPFSLTEAIFTYLRIWLVFPIVAIPVSMVLGVRHHYASWLILHNWAVLFLILVQTVIFIIFAAGLTNLQGLAFMGLVYQVFRLFVHWRIADTALQLPLGASIAAADLPVMVDFLLIYGFSG